MPSLYSAMIDPVGTKSDSTKKQPATQNKFLAKDGKLRPGYVCLMSTVLPGSGQIYNKQWYKTPFLYAGFAFLGYLEQQNQKEYKSYKKAYILRTDGDANTKDEFDPTNPAHGAYLIYSENQILSDREDFHRNRDLTVLGMFALYMANVLDAYIYAHLRNFDVSDDLSFRLEPGNFSIIANSLYYTPGIRVKF